MANRDVPREDLMKMLPLWLFVSCMVLSASVQSEPATVPESLYAPLHMEVGTWDAAVQYFEDDKPSGTASGVEVNTLLLNGHWIVNDFKIPATDKVPAYQGHGVWGYDPVAKTYVNTWVDTNDQTVRTDYGFWSEVDTTMVWSSKQNDGNGHYIDYRLVEEFKGQERVVTVVQLGLVKSNPHPLLKIVFTKKEVDTTHSDSTDPPHRQYKRPGT
jgi:hypothetical protein